MRTGRADPGSCQKSRHLRAEALEEAAQENSLEPTRPGPSAGAGGGAGAGRGSVLASPRGRPPLPLLQPQARREGSADSHPARHPGGPSLTHPEAVRKVPTRATPASPLRLCNFLGVCDFKSGGRFPPRVPGLPACTATSLDVPVDQPSLLSLAWPSPPFLTALPLGRPHLHHPSCLVPPGRHVHLDGPPSSSSVPLACPCSRHVPWPAPAADPRPVATPASGGDWTCCLPAHWLRPGRGCTDLQSSVEPRTKCTQLGGKIVHAVVVDREQSY
ncbi:unnamed protein product [Rangifer tarandus platyrhynchus]|uniref:Uncharacterized protein n=1 Tax=Rangifer tarandus platyrhynchus TaxID=3082113 RepID=A0AC59YPS6_RANTA